jgi:hypothetical protein
MQDRPEAPDLLDAIADLLIKEILPLVQEHGDDALAYKTLVSWNMLGVVARELKNAENLLNDEIARLAGLMDRQANQQLQQSYQAKLNLVREWNQELSRRIRDEKIGPENRELWEHAKQTLKEKLAVANPRFSQE